MKDYTHICIVLDASGSMEDIQKATRKSFNEFIKEQGRNPGKTTLDMYQFNDDVNRIVEHAELSPAIGNLMDSYSCNGCTALNDAICTAIDTLGKELDAMKENDRPDNVLFVIITDGMENSSRNFTIQDVKNRIQEQTNVYNWKFLFLAANMDAIEAGGQMGIDADDCKEFKATPKGMSSACCCISSAIHIVKSPKKKKK